MLKQLVKSKAILWSLVCLGLVLFMGFLFGLPEPYSGFGWVEVFPSGFRPLLLSIALIPVLISILEWRRRDSSVWGKVFTNLAVTVSATLISYLIIGVKIFFKGFEKSFSGDTDGVLSWHNLLFVVVWILLPTLLFGVEQTGRGSHSRVLLAVLTISLVIVLGFLWQFRLRAYFWWTSFFEQGWLDWRARILFGEIVLITAGVVAALGRLRNTHPRRALLIRGTAFLLAASVFGIPYRHPAIWREEEIEEIGFAMVTKNNDLIVVASRHSELPNWQRPGALLRRRVGEKDFTCLTRGSIMAPRVSSRYGGFATVELVTPWAALLGPGSRMRVATFDESCSRLASSFELRGSAACGNDIGGPWVELGPKCTCINGNDGFEDPGAVWLANGRVSDFSVPQCGERWIAGSQLIHLREECEAGQAPWSCCGEHAELIKVNLLSGTIVRKELRFPGRVRSWHWITPSGEKFTVESVDSTDAWFCDLEGNYQPTVLPVVKEPRNPFDYTPLLWSRGEKLEILDQSAYQVALRSFDLKEKDLKEFFPRAVKIGDHMILEQRYYYENMKLNNIYEFEVLEKKFKLISRRVMNVDYTSNFIVMLVCEQGARRVEQYWPNTGKREILLTAPVICGYQPELH